MKPKKLAIILLTSIIVMVILFLTVINITRSGKSSITIETSPSKASVMVDGKESSKNPYLKNGTYEISATYDGFAKKTQTVTVDGSEPKAVSLVLEPVNDTGEKFLKDNNTEQLDRERIGGQAFSQGSQEIEEKYPFIASLPLEGKAFSVNYGDIVGTKAGNSRAIALYVDAVDASERRSALKNISKELGIQYYDIEIVFENNVNPFLRPVSEE